MATPQSSKKPALKQQKPPGTLQPSQKRVAEPGTSISPYGALQQVVDAVSQNKLPTTALVPALKSQMSQADLQREFGITGTTNFRGDLLTESNSKLVHQLAFGQPGSRTWGEWERILMTDPSVSVAYEASKMQVRDAEVDVVPADPDLFTDRKSAQQQADFLKWNLLAALEPSWTETIQQMCNALNFGFTLHEVIAGQAEHPTLPGGKGYKLAKLAERLPVSIHPMGWIESPETHDLTAVRQWGNYPGTGQWTEALLPAEKLLLHTWNRRGNNYLGFPAWRSVWYWCKEREQIAKLVGISLIREGAGVPVAYTDKPSEAGIDPKSRKQLLKFLSNLVFHENAAAVLPPGWKLEWFMSPGANKGHILDVYNSIGTIILQQVMATHLALGVHGNTGNRSLGETQNDVADAFAAGILASIAGVINGTGDRPYTGLAKKIIQWNWGPQPAYPTVTLTLKKAKIDPAAYAAGVVAMKGAGIITLWSADDENDAREHYGLRPIDADEFDAEKERKQAIAATLPGQPPPGSAPHQPPPAPGNPSFNSRSTSAKTERPPPDPGADGTSPKPPAKLADGDAFTSWRPLRPSEQNIALADIKAFLDSSRDSFERGARPLVAELLAKALPDVKEALKDHDPAELANVELDTKRLSDFIGTFIEKSRAEGYRQVGAEARKAGVKDVALAADERDTDTDEDDQYETLLAAMQQQATRQLQNRLKEQLEAAAIDVERTGGDASEAVGEVLAAQTEGRMLANAASMVTTKAFNMGREQFADEYADSIESVELTAVLDDDTCDYCEQHDGDEFDFDSSEHDSMTPPLRDCDGRDRCRCILIYNFRSQ